MSRKRSNWNQPDEVKEIKPGHNDTQLFIILTIILSTICMVAAFLIPEDIAKWIIVICVFFGGGGYWWFSTTKKRNQDG